MNYLQGAALVGAQAVAKRAIVIRVNNLAEVVKKRGGSVGDLAQTLLPETIETQFFSEMQKEMIRQFRSEGVDVSVDVVANDKAPASKPVAGRLLWRDFGLGVFAGVVSGTLMHWAFGGRGK